MNEVAFEVGGTYENEKGVYEVVSIDENQNEMVIKWKDGKEFTTSIGLQWRILERRRIEREMAASKNGPKSRKSRVMGARFQGFLGWHFRTPIWILIKALMTYRNEFIQCGWTGVGYILRKKMEWVVIGGR